MECNEELIHGSLQADLDAYLQSREECGNSGGINEVGLSVCVSDIRFTDLLSVFLKLPGPCGQSPVRAGGSRLWFADPQVSHAFQGDLGHVREAVREAKACHPARCWESERPQSLEPVPGYPSMLLYLWPRRALLARVLLSRGEPGHRVLRPDSHIFEAQLCATAPVCALLH